jgi:hypothetical protein
VSLPRAAKTARTKIPHVHREIDENEGGEGGKRVERDKRRRGSFFFLEHDQGESRREERHRSERVKVKRGGPEENLERSNGPIRDESGAEEALTIRASTYSLADFTSASSGRNGARSDVVLRWAHSDEFVVKIDRRDHPFKRPYAKMS